MSADYTTQIIHAAPINIRSISGLPPHSHGHPLMARADTVGNDPSQSWLAPVAHDAHTGPVVNGGRAVEGEAGVQPHGQPRSVGPSPAARAGQAVRRVGVRERANRGYVDNGSLMARRLLPRSPQRIARGTEVVQSARSESIHGSAPWCPNRAASSVKASGPLRVRGGLLPCPASPTRNRSFPGHSDSGQPRPS